MRFRDEDAVPLLTPEEAERGIVLVQGDDGGWYVADTVIDPETGGVFAVQKPDARPNQIVITED